MCLRWNFQDWDSLHKDIKIVNMMRLLISCLFLSFIIAIVTSSNSSVTYQNIPASEFAALEDLYDSTNGIDWNWSDDDSVPWDFTGDANPCTDDWEGVSCLFTPVNSTYYLCNVEGLLLNSMNLFGTIPPTIGNFSCLSELQLFANVLYSSIPGSIGNLKNLSRLDLNTNELNGSIPSTIGDLHKLRSINLAVNALDGSLPVALGNLMHLEFFEVQSNQLTSSVPESYGNLHDMLVFNLYNNEFSGPFPNLVCNYTLLLSMGVSTNNWTGTISDCIGNLTHVLELYLFQTLVSGPLPSTLSNMVSLLNLDASHNTFLTGPIPDLSALSNLTDLYLNNCQFSGTVPDSLSNLTSLISLYLENLYLTGTLPSALFSLKTVTFFDFYLNYLTGTLSPSIAGIAAVQNLYLGQNLFTGSLPPQLFELSYLLDMQLQFCLFSGSLPSNIGGLINLNTMYLTDNRLTGSLPRGIGQIPYLQFVFLSENKLTGNLDHLANSSVQSLLISIDVSSNQFTGSLPTEPFLVPTLQTFSSLINCLEGTVPSLICRAKQLQYLSLDGLSTAPACRHLNIPGVAAAFDSYSLSSSRRVSGSIPSCLFEMKSLISLHLSGNALTGTIALNTGGSEVVTINGTTSTASFTATGIVGSLLDLSLSNNQLTGTVPPAIQQRHWLDLDLSYNELTGVLQSDVPSILSNETVSFQVNRLSGPIPRNYLSAEQINILNGNMFTCDNSESSSLPSADPDYRTYNCGSNSLNESMYIWVALALLVGVLIIAALFHEKLGRNCVGRLMDELKQTVLQWWGKFWTSSSKDLVKFQLLQRKLIAYCGWITSAAVVIFLPTYAALTLHYKTYEYEYAWNVSAAFLSGKTPGYVLFSFFAAAVVLVTLVCWRSFRARNSNAFTATNNESRKGEPWCSKSLFLLLLVMVLNAAVVLTVNGLYVYSVLLNTRSVVFVEQVLIAVFKIFWNEVFVSSVLSYIKKHYSPLSTVDGEQQEGQAFVVRSENRNTLILLSMTLFSVVVVPWIVTLVISSDCFYNYFIPPQPISVSYTFNYCTNYNTVPTPTGNINNCTVTSGLTATSTYSPPFSYSYQCSSSLITNYANVYVYMFVIVAFMEPLYCSVLVRVNDRSSNGKYPVLHRLTNMIMPSLLRRYSPPEKNQGGGDDRGSNSSAVVVSHQILFHKDTYITRMITYLCLLLTFGVGFPPLSLVISGGVLSYNTVLQVYVGRWFVLHPDRTHGLLVKDFRGISSNLSSSLWMVLPIVSIFYAFFILDTLGSEVGWRRTVGPAVLLACLPVMVAGCVAVVGSGYRWVSGKRSEEAEDDKKIREKSLDKVQMVDVVRKTNDSNIDSPMHDL